MKEPKMLRETSIETLLIMESCACEHNPDLNEEICRRAGLLEEYQSSDGETFEAVLSKAVEILESRDDDTDNFL